MSEETRQNIKVVCRVRPSNKIELGKVSPSPDYLLSPGPREAPTA